MIETPAYAIVVKKDYVPEREKSGSKAKEINTNPFWTALAFRADMTLLAIAELGQRVYGDITAAKWKSALDTVTFKQCMQGVDGENITAYRLGRIVEKEVKQGRNSDRVMIKFERPQDTQYTEASR